MSFMLYEVWAGDENGREELVGTTASRPDAIKMANETLESVEQYVEVWVSQENEEGDLDEILRLTFDDSGSIINV